MPNGFFNMPDFSEAITEAYSRAFADWLAASGATGGASGAGGGVITAPQPSAEVQALLGSIPFANDGDVITAAHFTTLRSAVARIAGALEDTQFAKQFTLTFTPTLLEIPDGDPPFRVIPEGAAGPQAGDGAAGWMALDLPNGVDIESLTVRGVRPSGVTIWSVALRRIELANGAVADVAVDEIQAAPTTVNRFSAVVAAAAGETVPSVASNLRRVDTSRYRYLFDTSFAGAQQADAVQINAVQVTCRREES